MLLKDGKLFILAKTEDWIYFQTGDRVSRTRNQQDWTFGRNFGAIVWKVGILYQK